MSLIGRFNSNAVILCVTAQSLYPSAQFHLQFRPEQEFLLPVFRSDSSSVLREGP